MGFQLLDSNPGTREWLMMMLDTAALCLSFFLSLFLSFFFSISLTSVNIKRFIGVSNENIHDLNLLFLMKTFMI